MAAPIKSSLLIRSCKLNNFLFDFVKSRTLVTPLNRLKSTDVFSKQNSNRLTKHKLAGNNAVHQVQALSQRQLFTTKQCTVEDGQFNTIASQEQNKPDSFLEDFEVSHEEFKFVEQVLPSPTVPELKELEAYPTPSGWFPPNESLCSSKKYLVRRTKNHMLPIYSVTQEKWHGVAHYVCIKKIEGDIWALEAELRDLIMRTTGQKSVTTQVHEVGRFIRVRGQHRDTIATYLLDNGM